MDSSDARPGHPTLGRHGALDRDTRTPSALTETQDLLGERGRPCGSHSPAPRARRALLAWPPAPRPPVTLVGPATTSGTMSPSPCEATGRWTSVTAETLSALSTPTRGSGRPGTANAQPAQPVWVCKCQRAPGGSQCQAGVPGRAEGQLQPQAVNRLGGRRYKGPQPDTPPRASREAGGGEPCRKGWLSPTRLTLILGRRPHPQDKGRPWGLRGPQGVQRRQEKEEGGSPAGISLEAAAWPGL